MSWGARAPALLGTKIGIINSIGRDETNYPSGGGLQVDSPRKGNWTEREGKSKFQVGIRWGWLNLSSFRIKDEEINDRVTLLVHSSTAMGNCKRELLADFHCRLGGDEVEIWNRERERGGVEEGRVTHCNLDELLCLPHWLNYCYCWILLVMKRRPQSHLPSLLLLNSTSSFLLERYDGSKRQHPLFLGALSLSLALPCYLPALFARSRLVKGSYKSRWLLRSTWTFTLHLSRRQHSPTWAARHRPLCYHTLPSLDTWLIWPPVHVHSRFQIPKLPSSFSSLK